MGKQDDRWAGRGGKFKSEGRRPREDVGELSHRPFQEHEREQRTTGLPCMKCGDPVDAREGYSVTRPWGPKRPLRQGYLHDKCLKEAEGKDTMTVPENGGKPELWEPFAKMFGARSRFSVHNPEFIKALDSAKKVLYAQQGVSGEVLRMGELVVATRSVLEVPIFTEQELDEIVDSGTRS